MANATPKNNRKVWLVTGVPNVSKNFDPCNVLTTAVCRFFFPFFSFSLTFSENSNSTKKTNKRKKTTLRSRERPRLGAHEERPRSRRQCCRHGAICLAVSRSPIGRFHRSNEAARVGARRDGPFCGNRATDGRRDRVLGAPRRRRQQCRDRRCWHHRGDRVGIFLIHLFIFHFHSTFYCCCCCLLIGADNTNCEQG